MTDASRGDEDRVLVERALSAPEGDTRAFEELVRRHTRGVISNCRYITRSPTDAEDLAQDVFIKVYFALRRFERRSSFRTWLHRIKVNRCLDHLKRHERDPVVELDDSGESPAAPPDSTGDAWERMHHDDERRRITAVLDEMTDTLRVPLILCDMDEMPYQEIADLLGIGLSAVKMRIKRARADFRERYQRSATVPDSEARE